MLVRVLGLSYPIGQRIRFQSILQLSAKSAKAGKAEIHAPVKSLEPLGLVEFTQYALS